MPVRTSAPASNARQNDPGSTQPPWGNQRASALTGMPASSKASQPVTGRITAVRYIPGRFLPAYRPDAARANERCEISIDHDGTTVIARQVVGVLARRVVCRARPEQAVRAGERYGIMKFGSRMDVFLPPTADLRVAVGDRTRGGETVIAVLH